MRILKIVAWILLIAGGLNWGIIGLANANLIGMAFGGTGIDRLLYVLIGASAVYACFCCRKGCSSAECK